MNMNYSSGRDRKGGVLTVLWFYRCTLPGSDPPSHSIDSASFDFDSLIIIGCDAWGDGQKITRRDADQSTTPNHSR